jgi:serine/threonine protein kinase
MEYLNKVIDKYKLTRFIGEGGMASVYEGTHEKLGTKVAVKILNPILTANQQIRMRFENEAKFMASLNHPNITRVIDYDEQPDTLAIIMELLNGQDLSTLIKTKGPLTPEQAIPVFSQVLDAFQYAHSKGIIHRDIKPSNIILNEDNQVKILDFGIAKILGAENDFTSTGTQLGTPVYMSPEQVKSDKSIDHRSDIYSLGVTLFFTLNGRPPYDNTAQSNFEIFNKIVFEPIPDLTKYPEINQVIKKAVAKDRDQRFQSAAEFKSALQKINFGLNKSVPEAQDDKTLIETNEPAILHKATGDVRKITDKPLSAKQIEKIEPKEKAESKKAVLASDQKPEAVENPKRKRNIFIGVGLGAVVLVVALFFLYQNNEIKKEQLAEKIRLDNIRIADSIETVKETARLLEKKIQDSLAVVAAYNNSPTGKAEKLILGKHPFTLQWISWDYTGSVNIYKEDGQIKCKGQQVSRENSSDYVKIDGTIDLVNEKEFVFHGTILTKISYINNGMECQRNGAYKFASTSGRQYWRMQDMLNPCEGVTDYVDVYFSQL